MAELQGGCRSLYRCRYHTDIYAQCISEMSALHSLPPAGKEPVSRKFQSLTAIGNQMAMFGGQSLEDNADLNDLFFLSKVSACMPYCGALPASHVLTAVVSCFDRLFACSHGSVTACL